MSSALLAPLLAFDEGRVGVGVGVGVGGGTAETCTLRVWSMSTEHVLLTMFLPQSPAQTMGMGAAKVTRTPLGKLPLFAGPGLIEMVWPVAVTEGVET